MTSNPSTRELKEQALRLLEWALEDMSPAGGPKLHFKCGFEREGHFVPQDLPLLPPGNKAWRVALSTHMEHLVGPMNDLITQDTDIDRVYKDKGGTFIFEPVTKTLDGVLKATQAIERASRRMLQEAPHMGFAESAFGTMPTQVVHRLVELAKTTPFLDAGEAFENFGGEVFDTPDKGLVLAGRGQHCNISLWMGDQELLRHQGSAAGAFDLVNHAAQKMVQWMPAMFLPCRKGNYLRLAADSAGAANDFAAGDLDGSKAPFMLRYTADKVFRGHKAGSYRFELRTGAAEADPYDVALAAAAPLAKACEEALEMHQGKLVLGQDRRPRVHSTAKFPTKPWQPVPCTEQEAASLFIKSDNPYFQYLDELAARRIQRAEEQEGPTAAGILRSRIHHLGTRLFSAYCEEYGLRARHDGVDAGPDTQAASEKNFRISI